VDDSSLYALFTEDELEAAIDRLEVVINRVLEEQVVSAQLSLYTKR